MSEIARGVGQDWDVLDIHDGMSVQELVQDLMDRLPPTARIHCSHFDGLGADDDINANRVRLPILVREGKLSEETQALAKLAVKG